MRHPVKLKPRSSVKGDKHIGVRVRMRRMELKISQAELGDVLGVSFQQIQKYEKGVNRIAADRLNQIAAALDCPLAFFFENAPGKSAGGDDPAISKFMTSADGMAIAKAFLSLPEGKPRLAVRRVIETLAEGHAAISAPARRAKAA